jgi:NADPH:quinone reductase-like Zn-dependent oxidoreductase
VRAVAIDEFGGPERLTVRELPDPRVGPDFALVRIRAAGVNPVDWKLREGRLVERFPHRFPIVPGWDAAGLVEAVGPAVVGLEPGSEVIAYCRKHWVQEGTYAELVSVPAAFLAPRPPSLSWAAAAALPLAGLTAHQSLIEALDVNQGATLLIHAAAGGVGSFAVQIASDANAHVLGTASARNHDHLRELGAARALDYHEDWAGQVREAHPDGIDAVLDTVGGETLEASLRLLGDGGRIASIVDPTVAERAAALGRRGRYVYARPDGGRLAVLGRMVEDGRLQVHVERTFPLEAAAEAHALLQEGHVRGKLALEL